ncbi:uncharacterized protein B0H18DRAFT_389484 [Fomitopsis serialis]|uniref:uncharacterized protein n=1 Tax=Fomitopsis serialis TaxID=139415 RepID=UPI0020089D08|nr:uncharacterized protein B0H18DRAFT_389484 [Neoantrodia serialis]KAH9925167.1 hypothetical protein B0H18DRAFT_389484 [Neoantrodia serialis]
MPCTRQRPFCLPLPILPFLCAQPKFCICTPARSRLLHACPLAHRTRSTSLALSMRTWPCAGPAAPAPARLSFTSLTHPAPPNPPTAASPTSRSVACFALLSSAPAPEPPSCVRIATLAPRSSAPHSPALREPTRRHGFYHLPPAGRPRIWHR